MSNQTDLYTDLLGRQRTDYAKTMMLGARSIRWPQDRLAAHRQSKLRDLLSSAVSKSDFYRKRFDGIDVSSFTEADLPTLPTLTKSDMMDNFDDLVTDKRLTLAAMNKHLEHLDTDNYLFDRYRLVSTSGSTGARALLAYDWEEWCTFAAIATRWQSREVKELPPGHVTASFFAANPRHVSGALNSFFHNLPSDSGQTFLHLPASMPLVEIVGRLNEADPLVLSGYPSLVLLLAREALAGRLAIRPRLISTCGEQCGPDVLSAVHEAWGLGVYDYWGCTEGVYAFPCGVGSGMHIPDDSVVLEVVDANGNPVPDGTQGEKILLTVLYCKTQPLIRYEISDRMTITREVCECGCAHSRITNISGRSTTSFTYPNGTAIHWLGMMGIMLATDWVSESQVRQTSNGVEVRVTTRGPKDYDGLRSRFYTLLQKSGLTDPEVIVSEVSSLDRLWSGKLQQFVPLAS